MVSAAAAKLSPATRPLEAHAANHTLAFPVFALAQLKPQLVCANFNQLTTTIIVALRTANVQLELALVETVLGIQLVSTVPAPVNAVKVRVLRTIQCTQINYSAQNPKYRSALAITKLSASQLIVSYNTMAFPISSIPIIVYQAIARPQKRESMVTV